MSRELKRFIMLLIMLAMALSAYMVGMYPVALIAGIFSTVMAIQHWQELNRAKPK